MHELQYRFGTAARASLPLINNVKYQSAVAGEPPLIVARFFQVNKVCQLSGTITSLRTTGQKACCSKHSVRRQALTEATPQRGQGDYIGPSFLLV
jgi:hypothetical protein